MRIVSLAALLSLMTAAHAVTITDQELLAFAAGPQFQFYKNDSSWLEFTPRGGGHAGFIRIRFNPLATADLDVYGKLPLGSEFRDGSLVVKEIRDDLNGSLSAIAIMLKMPAASNSNLGWVWGEYEADGRPIVSAGSNGRACVRCHSVTSANSPVRGDQGHRDFIRTFGLRP